MNLPSLPKTKRTFEHPLWPHKIKYSAFTSGQQSLLLQVADKDTPVQDRIDTMTDLFSQVVDAGAPFTQLPTCIVEKVFLLMRCISVGDVLKVNFVCEHKIDKESCGQRMTMPIDLNSVNIVIPEGYKEEFELAEGYFIKMKKPTYGTALNLKDTNDIPLLFSSFTHSIYTEEEAWVIEDPDEEGISSEERESRKVKFKEFVSWVSENLDVTMIMDIKNNFFDKLPHLHYTNKAKCPKCGTSHPIVFNGLDEVFI